MEEVTGSGGRLREVIKRRKGQDEKGREREGVGRSIRGGEGRGEGIKGFRERLVRMGEGENVRLRQRVVRSRVMAALN